MNNQPKDKCIDCGGDGNYPTGYNPHQGEIMENCPTCKGTGEGETKVYTHGSIEHGGERWIRSIDHENLIALALQEQREEFKELIKEWIEKGFSLETLLDNVDIIPLKKELKNLE